MTELRVVDDARDIGGAVLIEGLPGIGLVAKIVTDYLIDELDMQLYAEVYGTDLPQVPVFHYQDRTVTPAIRIFVNEELNVATLCSDILLSANATEFITEITDWIEQHRMHPIYQVGLPLEFGDNQPHLFGVSTTKDERLEHAGIPVPPLDGGITGPSGAFLAHALERDLSATGLIVESDPFFPDPEAAQIMIEKGIGPLAGLNVDTRTLEDSADQIREQKEQFAQMVQAAMEERTNQAYPREIYQ